MLPNSEIKCTRELQHCDLLVDGCNGIYVAQAFTYRVDMAHLEGVDPEDWNILRKGPDDSEHYFETWQEVSQNAVILARNDNDAIVGRYRLDVNDDVFLIPAEFEWCDECEWYHKPLE